MEEQLPTPIVELLLLNFYLGAISILLAITFVAFVMVSNSNFKWRLFIGISLAVGFFGSILSLLSWFFWIPQIELMFGAVHFPTLVSGLIVSVLLLKLFGYKILAR